ncbi:stage III sporulation protein AF [Bacillus altitudinis MN12]|uniref:Stage III sporulation protein AF n=1 Tax=Bacillus aerius TaxID=293388 RepID=A0ABR6B3Y5_9BACI|nr:MULTISPECIES: stage III sporulation protein AF [Bacillus]ANT57207.1 stage III sporulation protein AF [Bacillus pumilus]EMI12227.1 stage iii sporulation protein af [Bacillus stratosphericus LAMA 585]KML18646.1 stage III sporulation protein AF [Bacillus stratosphericus]MBW3700395.1 stage III sporulation protein AF [Bacillus aerophilus]MDH8710951.1 stage III sporulation protein AF [Micromonospora sp. 1209]CVM16097.1 stage III sporulation protein AF [Streptococcus pneumoniae]
MSFLTEWITSIILFILFAIVIDLLLPNSSMQKYAKMVVSLLLIVVMLNPIFALFRADPDQIFSEIMKGKDQAQSEEIKNQMNLEKKEIQASQRAYILKQMAVQLEKSAKEPLEKESYEMKHVEVLADEEHLDQNMEADQFRIKAVLVPLTGDAVETVAKVDIDLSRQKEESAGASAKEMARVKETLADVWNTRPEHIALNIEGGDAADHE